MYPSGQTLDEATSEEPGVGFRRSNGHHFISPDLFLRETQTWRCRTRKRLSVPEVGTTVASIFLTVSTGR